MGGDGGSIASRADMVKTKGYRFLRNLGGMGYVPNTQVREGDERLRRSEARDLQLSTCSLSQEPLRTPVVACRLGRLYNKEELLSRLLSKSMPPHLQHISSLKDVQQCNVELNRETHFLVCPVSRVDIRSGIKASIIWPCGCVVADKARRVAATAAANAAATAAEKTGPSTASSGSNGAEERTAQNGSEPGRDSPPTPVAANAGVPDGEIPCINCGKPYDPAEDLVPLLPDEEELEKLQEKVKKLAEAKHAAKQAKKARAANSLPENGVGGSLSSSMDSCAGSSSGGSAGGSSSSVRSSSSDSSSSSGSSSRSSSGGIGGIDVKHNTGSSASATADGRNTSSSSSGSSSSAVKSGSASKSGGLHPAAVAPCATSTRLQADSFAWMRKEREEKQRKRKQRDWVLSSGGAVDEIVGTVMAPRAVRAGEHAASRT